jgi:hypothetical protein
VSVVRSFLFWVLPAVLSIGCAGEIDQGAVLGSKVEVPSDPRDPSGTTKVDSATASTPANACDAAASWSARSDLAFDRSDADDTFADTIHALIRESDVAPLAVSSHMNPGCVWTVAFSAADSAQARGAEHAATFTPMLRHPAGLWTAAPQSNGWMRVVDRAARVVWIPLADLTGSATYGEASCASLSAVRISASVPTSAAGLTLTTTAGDRTVRQLMGTEPSARGWSVRFTFSADIAR